MLKINRYLVILFLMIYVADSGWQRCNAKCYYLADANLAFAAIESYCKTMSPQATPADFGTKLEQTLKTELSTCRLQKKDNDPYWINRHNIFNHSDHDCRTVTFSGNDVHYKTIPCASRAMPLCEIDNTSFCQASNKTESISSDWVSVSGQDLSYKLSAIAFTYCDAQSYCENGLHGQIAHQRDYSYMGLLASQLGIVGQVKLDFWLASPGVSCPQTHGDGSVMRFTGPFVHLLEQRPLNEIFRVLCEKNLTATTAVSTVSTSYPATEQVTITTTTATTKTTTITIPTKIRSLTTQFRITSPSTTLKTQPPPTQPKVTSQTTTLQTTQFRITSPSTTLKTEPPPTQPKITSQTTTLQTTQFPTTETKHTSPTTQLQTQSPSTQTKLTLHTTKLQTTHLPTTQTKKTSPTTRPPITQPKITSSKTKLPTQPPTTHTNKPSLTTELQYRISTTQNEMTSPSTALQTHPPSTHMTKTSLTTQLQTRTPTTQNKMTSPTTPLKTQLPTTHTKRTSPTTKLQNRPPTPQTIVTSPITPLQTQPLTIHTKLTLPNTQFQTIHQETTSQFYNTRNDTAVEEAEWIRIGQEEYFVNYNSTSYDMAEKFCREKLNASLIMFRSPVKYFMILAQIAKQNSSFWVGAHSMNKTVNSDDCLSYTVNTETMTTVPCQLQQFSVCSRFIRGDISQLLKDPGFRKMLKEMTVLKNETQKNIRKLTCAEDRRTSARAAGGVGVFTICSVLTLLLVSDCSGIKSNFFNRKKKPK